MEYLVLASGDPSVVSCPCASCRYFEYWPEEDVMDAMGLCNNQLFPLDLSSGWVIALLEKRPQ